MNEPCVLLVLLALLDGGGGGRYAGSIRVGFHKRTVLSFAPVIQYLPSAVVWYATRWIEIEVRKGETSPLNNMHQTYQLTCKSNDMDRAVLVAA